MKDSIFNKALDALNEYMFTQGGVIFDPPTKMFSTMDEQYVYLANAVNNFGKYEIATEEFIPDIFSR